MAIYEILAMQNAFFFWTISCDRVFRDCVNTQKSKFKIQIQNSFRKKLDSALAMTYTITTLIQAEKENGRGLFCRKRYMFHYNINGSLCICLLNIIHKSDVKWSIPPTNLSESLVHSNHRTKQILYFPLQSNYKTWRLEKLCSWTTQSIYHKVWFAAEFNEVEGRHQTEGRNQTE